jgi:hypothetical protein
MRNARPSANNHSTDCTAFWVELCSEKNCARTRVWCCGRETPCVCVDRCISCNEAILYPDAPTKLGDLL